MESLNNDEPIHHSEGKDLLRSCPSLPPIASTGTSSSPIKQSPHATISPPVKRSLLKLLGLLKRFVIFRANNQTSPSIINYYFIENRTIEKNNNLTYNNAMKIIGQVLNNYGTIQENNFYGKNEQQSKENEGKKDFEDIDHTEVVEVQPVPPRDENLSGIIRFFAQRSKARPILSWLHETTDDLETPKERLLYLRAVYEAGHFTQRIPYEIYVEEFGPITRSRYKYWMGEELKYSRKNIDDIIEQFPF